MTRVNTAGRPICGAKKKDGTPCQSTQIMGNTGRCRLHGGKSPAGMASPNFRHGRHSKYLPARLAAKFAEAEADPTLYDLRSEVALVDTRLGELLERVENRDSAEIWKQLDGAYQDVRKALFSDKSDEKAVLFALGNLEKLIGQGLGDWATWKEIGGMVEQRRKLVESERTHQKQMQMMVSIDQMMLAVGAIMSSIKDHKDKVLDQSALTSISQKIDALLGGGRA